MAISIRGCWKFWYYLEVKKNKIVTRWLTRISTRGFDIHF